MSPNFNELEVICLEEEVDFICLSETHLTKDIDNSEIALRNFNVIRCDSISRHTGGVCFYVNNRWKNRILDCKAIDKKIWWLKIEITYEHTKYYLVAVYRSPNIQNSPEQHFIEFFEQEMDAIDQRDNYLIIGDFNIDWLGNSSHKRRLEEIINDNYFNQLVTVPTRISSNTVSLIDYAVTNVEDVLICINDKMKISDHESLEIRMPVRNYVELAGAKTVRMFRYNNNVFRNSLLFGELNNLSSAVSLNEFAKILTHVIKHSLNSMVVDKNVRLANNDSLWFNNNLKRMKQNKIQLYNLAVWYNNEFHWRNYRRIRNKYRNELKKSKATYINNKINCCTNQKDMWRAIKNHVLKKENSQVEEIEVNGEIISDSQEIAEYLNSFFIKSVKEIAESIPHLPYENIINESQNIAFNFEIIDIPELIGIMKSMNNKKDQNFLNIKMLLDNFDIIGTHIHRLIVESLQTGIFPEILKEACIVPIKKVQNTKNPAEIRPVNMLSTISKLMEKVVYNQLSKHFENNNILFEIQSGFRKKHNCESLLNLVVSQWKMEMEKKVCSSSLPGLKKSV